MAGLKGETTTIGVDGRTVTTVTESAATAREVAARQEHARRDIEGGPWAKFNARLDRAMQRADETGGIFSDRALELLAWGFTFFSIMYAWNAWYKLLPVPGLNLLLACVGSLLIYGMKSAAARLDKAWADGDNVLGGWLSGILLGGLILQAVVSASLYALVSVDQQTGRRDVETTISDLRVERANLQIQIATPPEPPAVTAEMQQKLIDGFKLKQAVNSLGKVLEGPGYRIGALVGDCKGSSYYVTTYCPTILELETVRDQALNYDERKAEHDAVVARFNAIPAEIVKLQHERPQESSTFALGNRVFGVESNLSLLVWPMVISFILDFLMLLFSYLSKRAVRTNDEPLVLTTPAAASAEPIV